MRKSLIVLILTVLFVTICGGCTKGQDKDEDKTRTSYESTSGTTGEELPTADTRQEDVSGRITEELAGFVNEKLILEIRRPACNVSLEYHDILKIYEAKRTVMKTGLSDSFCSHMELKVLQELLLRDTEWYAEDLSDEEKADILEMSGSGYDSVALSNGSGEEWIFLYGADSYCIHRTRKDTQYYRVVLGGGSAAVDEIYAEYEYLKQYGQQTDIQEVFKNVCTENLVIEYKSEYGNEKLTVDEMVAAYNFGMEITGREEHRTNADSVLKNVLKTEWLLGNVFEEDTDEELLKEKVRQIQEGAYFKFYSDASCGFIFSVYNNDIIYYNNDVYRYYTNWYGQSEKADAQAEEYTAKDMLEFKREFDFQLISGLNMVLGPFDTALSDEKLAELCMEEYAERYLSCLPDNYYGAKDIKDVNIAIPEEWFDMDMYEKAFVGSYKLLPNNIEAYEIQAAEGGIEDGYIIDGSMFYFKLYDGAWYMVSHGWG